MVDREIFSRRLEALADYLRKLGAFREVVEAEFVEEPRFTTSRSAISTSPSKPRSISETVGSPRADEVAPYSSRGRSRELPGSG
jgi:hypothetical protein